MVIVDVPEVVGPVVVSVVVGVVVVSVVVVVGSVVVSVVVANRSNPLEIASGVLKVVVVGSGGIVA